MNTDVKIIAKKFYSTSEPVLLPGGHGTTWRAGEIILSPTSDSESSNWLSSVFDTLPTSKDIRIPRPIKSVNNKWVEDGYGAWTYVEGEHEAKRYAEKIIACDSYHSLISYIKNPEFNEPTDPWSIAEKVAWQEIEAKYDKDFMDIINPVIDTLLPIDAPSQVIHSDMLENFLFKEGLPSAVIDFSPTWRPVGFAKGIMFIDAIAWHGHDMECINAFRNIPNILQFTLRAALRRIVEQSEQVLQLNKDKQDALLLAKDYGNAIMFIMSVI